jgi:hypothetical protein
MLDTITCRISPPAEHPRSRVSPPLHAISIAKTQIQSRRPMPPTALRQTLQDNWLMATTEIGHIHALPSVYLKVAASS